MDDGNWTTYTEPITLTKNATIYARAIDIAGNQSDASHSVTSIGPPNPIVNVVGLSEDSVKVTDTQTYPEPVERQFSILKSGQIVQNSNWTDEEEYTFSGLDPNTIYDVQVDVRFK
ncbi:chitobiase/beta-hexosaminidase C-terminal domain-containing protein [Brevibacillus thermoruber]|uniref:chitobiase/beta-hexosaminidase C-terminal domain-containing protein n=1 Tax=Brevibacillus thermoruber TaxID=33942 RepID=UPI0039C75142